jgi:GrpB-like predicted nucleotidyltransferase (UPF0157 family)
MNIQVESYNPIWAINFVKIKNDLLKILQDIPILSIEHVGSTSIPGLAAKPVLDIDIVITPEILEKTRAAMVAGGYRDLGEMGVPGRVGFRQPGYKHWESTAGPTDDTTWEEDMRRNIYVILEGSVALKNHRDLKRILLQDEHWRERYGEVKRQLSEKEWQTIAEYCKGKNEIVLEMLVSAGWSGQELEEVRKANE